MMALADQQEIMGAIADMVIETFAMDSALVRARKLIEKNGESQAQLAIAMTQCYLMDAMQKLEAAARKVAPAVAEGDVLRSQMAIIRRLAKHEPANTIALRQEIAQRVIEAGKYTL
jgi:butyryl-CoA dehydrogenase